jgi:hypothetical protein
VIAAPPQRRALGQFHQNKCQNAFRAADEKVPALTAANKKHAPPTIERAANRCDREFFNGSQECYDLWPDYGKLKPNDS